MLREIDKAALLNAIKVQDLSNHDCQALVYGPEQLADAALGVVRDGFASLDLRKIEIKGNLALCVDTTPHLVVLWCLNQIVRRAINIQSSDRDTIIRRLSTILGEGVPHRLYKFDIKKFFDSIDVLELFGRLSNEARIPRSAILVLENFLYELVSRNIAGLPRGIQLSATLSEYAMNRFDRLVSRLPEVYFYARYVDDIVIVTGTRENKLEFERRVRKALPMGLRFNGTKTKYINIPVQVRSDGVPVVGDFDYLGYNFSVHETKRVENRFCRVVDVTIAPKKIRRIKSRICRALASFVIDGNKPRLERRLQFLTGNYNLRDLSSGRLRNVGLYCNYRRANSVAALVELDSFLRSVVIGNRTSLARRLATKMPYDARRDLIRFSFANNFNRRTFYNFKPSELADITLCWRDA